MYDLARKLAEILEEDNRYTVAAYEFVFEALAYAQDVLHMGTESLSEPNDALDEEEVEELKKPQPHVSGQDLCEAVRQYALRQYGYMAKTVLNSWGLYTTGDVGEIVFNLIRHGKMRKTKEDRREDFDEVYDFETAFRQQFNPGQPE
jgi:uncharacterized repeat protein (TIGR04138 family)